MAVRRRKSIKFTTLMQKKLLIIFMIVMTLLIALSVVIIRINASKGYEYSKAVYQRLQEKERVMREAIEQGRLETLPTSQEDLDTIFSDLRG